ncbi:uncharacterized protein BBOV_IV005240 [Babesia bovis T2Bo]|uniref:uncharacterized protein n=1 Tax=Babesia bovis T2Bo TaxID=484906 RepID=UPI001E0DC944|nr:uncharacterized protein BBOV_IV005240 [Babesia bovis T2Bo]EDO06885.2 hypothetical protein BBOV_IV005240 [Babesia bovis T2Bo]
MDQNGIRRDLTMANDGLNMFDQELVPTRTTVQRGRARFVNSVTDQLRTFDNNADEPTNIGNTEIDDQILLGQGSADYYTVAAPMIEGNDDRPMGFASLKTKTFDNNFKDLEGLKRKEELLHFSENYLHSKLYTPKLEALQRLVEPGKYTGKTKHRIGSDTITSKYALSRSTSIRKEDGEHATSVSSGEGRALSVQSGKSYGAQLKFGEYSDLKQTSEESRSIGVNEKKENVVMLLSSSQVVNGVKKKKITIPKSAYQPLNDNETKGAKVILKVVGNAKVEKEKELDRNDPITWMLSIENEIDNLVDTIELYGDNIVNPKAIVTQLEVLRPPWMPAEIFYLYCMKPIGMNPNEFMKLVESNNMLRCRDELQKFNVVNTNAMGYVLDAENETVEQLTKLNKVHKRLMNEYDIYTKIHTKMTENFNNQVEDLLKITRQDLRLAAGDTYLQYGSIKNITTWQKGDPVMREKGFSHDKASKDKMKTLQRMQEVFGEGTNVAYDTSAVDEAKYIYYMKLLQDMEDSERDELQQQLARDRTQALAEYSVLEPAFKPQECLAWKALGVSCNSIIWKMYNTIECMPVIYKIKTLEGAGSELINILKEAYKQAFTKIKKVEQKYADNKNIKFANGFEITDHCLVERMGFFGDTPVSELLEKMPQMKSAERFSQAQVIVREIAKMVNKFKNIDFILPLKSSRIYFFAGGAKLSAGIPQSLLHKEARDALNKCVKVTIASLLWGKTLEWYLPPEANGDPAFTHDTNAVSKAHVWMIGKILYEATCQTPLSRAALDYNQIELCEDADTRQFLKICLCENVKDRPTVEDILKHPFMKRHKVMYGALGPIDVGKVQCAVEILGDIETIVLNKINRTEKGVADYEQNDNWDMVLGDSEDDDLWSPSRIDNSKLQEDNTVTLNE